MTIMTKVSTKVHFFVLFLAIPCLADALFAQGRSRRGDGSDPFQVLLDDDHEAEFNLSDQQTEQIRKIQEDLRSEDDGGDRRRGFGSFPTDPKEQAEFFAKRRQEQEARHQAALAKIKGVLKSEQYQRLEQIRYRNMGTRALQTDQVAADLKLSDQQKAEIDKLAGEAMSARMRNFRAPREEQEKAQQEYTEKIMAVLSKEQQAAWQSKLGPEPKGDEKSSTPPAANTANNTPTSSAAPRATYEPPMNEGPVVVSFAGDQGEENAPPKEKGPAPEKPGLIQFHMENAPWEMVLNQFAKKANLTPQILDIPPGSLTYTNDDKWYTPNEALDILHGYLLQKGFVMIKRDRFLVVLSIDNRPIPPNLIPSISISELETGDFGRHEILNVVLPLQGADADDAAREVESLKGPQGTVVPLSVSNSLVVTDTYSNLKRIHNLLKGVTNNDPEEMQFKSFKLNHVFAEEAAITVKDQLGLDISGSSSDRARIAAYFASRDSRSRDSRSSSSNTSTAEARVTPDVRTNRLLIAATPSDLAIAEQVITTIDIEEEAGEFDGRPYLHVYNLRVADTDEVERTLNLLFPGTVVGEDEDRDGGRLHVKATPRQHQQIAQEIAKMDGASVMSSAVIPLTTNDPLGVATTLNTMFLADADRAPTIMADTAGRRLMVRGSSDQITEVRKILNDLGVSGEGGGQDIDRGPLRNIPLGGRDAEEFARILEQVWGRRSDTPIRVIIPSSNPIRDRKIPSMQRLNDFPFLDDLRPSTDRRPNRSESNDQKSTARDQDALFPVSLPDDAAEPAQAEQPEGDDSAEASEDKTDFPAQVTLRVTHSGEWLLNGEKTTAIALSKFASEWLRAIPEEQRKFILSTHPDTSTAASFQALGILQRSGIEPTLKMSADDAPAQPGNEQSSNANGPPASANTNEIPIAVTVRGGELMLFDPSGESEKLNEMEALIEQLALAIPPKTTWTVYYLRSAEATETATMLEQLFPSSSVSDGNFGDDGSFFGGLTSSLGSMGSSLADAAGLNTLTSSPGVLRIIPEVRSNSLFVSGPVDQVNQVEEMLRVLDADELPETLRERVPRTIPVLYANVAEVANIVKEVYKDYLEDNSSRQQQGRNPLELMMGGGRGGNRSGRDSGRGSSAPRMTIGVDTQTSELIVSASDALFQQVKDMVEERDEAAKLARRTIQVVNVNEENSVVLQQALTALLPSVSVSTTSSSSGSSSSGGPQPSFGGGSSDDAARRARFFEAMQRSRSGGDNSSRPTSRSSSDSGRSGFSGFGRGGSGRPSFGGFGRGSSGGSGRGSSGRSFGGRGR